MRVSEMRPPPGGFTGRLEAELVKVVTARAALPGRPRRRPAIRAGLLAAATAVAAAAGLALGGPSLSHQQAGPSQGAGAGPVHIRTAAFTVDTTTGGTIRLTWDKRQYIQYRQDIGGLQRALRAAGLPVLIKVGVFCQGPHDSGRLGPGGVGPGVGQVMKGENGPGGTVVFTFTPAAMPAGEELFIGYLSPSQLAITHGRPGSVERLVPAGGPLTCTTQAPLPQSGQPQPARPGSGGR